MADTLGVTDYWDTVDYLGLKHDEKAVKAQNRTSNASETPGSKYVNGETGYIIAQFKSPRAQHEATGPGLNALPAEKLLE